MTRALVLGWVFARASFFPLPLCSALSVSYRYLINAFVPCVLCVYVWSSFGILTDYVYAESKDRGGCRIHFYVALSGCSRGLPYPPIFFQFLSLVSLFQLICTYVFCEVGRVGVGGDRVHHLLGCSRLCFYIGHIVCRRVCRLCGELPLYDLCLVAYLLDFFLIMI